MARTPRARPTSWPMTMPPRAGESTVCTPSGRTRSAMARPQASASGGCWSTRAHCRYPGLCSPEVRRKCPSSRAPTARKRPRIESVAAEAIQTRVYLLRQANLGLAAFVYRPDPHHPSRSRGRGTINIRHLGLPPGAGGIYASHAVAFGNKDHSEMRNLLIQPCLFAVVFSFCTTGASVSAQRLAAQGQAAAAAEPIVLRLTVSDAVKLAAENNLGIEAERFNPQIQSLGVDQARGAWTPSISGTVLSNGNTS